MLRYGGAHVRCHVAAYDDACCVDAVAGARWREIALRAPRRRYKDGADDVDAHYCRRREVTPCRAVMMPAPCRAMRCHTRYAAAAAAIVFAFDTMMPLLRHFAVSITHGLPCLIRRRCATRYARAYGAARGAFCRAMPFYATGL